MCHVLSNSLYISFMKAYSAEASLSSAPVQSDIHTCFYLSDSNQPLSKRHKSLRLHDLERIGGRSASDQSREKIRSLLYNYGKYINEVSE